MLVFVMTFEKIKVGKFVTQERDRTIISLVLSLL